MVVSTILRRWSDVGTPLGAPARARPTFERRCQSRRPLPARTLESVCSPVEVPVLNRPVGAPTPSRQRLPVAALLTIGKLAAGQQQYYLNTVAGGAEEYYTTGKEQPGRWCGTSAARLNLTDGRSDPKVIGFDATFCAPKSVSLLYALADSDVSAQVRGAQDRAVNDAFSTRRNEIQAHLAERNETGAKAAQRAAYATRRPKDPNLNLAALLPAWRARADSLGFDHHALQATLNQTGRHVSASAEINTDRVFQALAGPAGLTAHRATFGRAQVIHAICDAPTLHTRRGGLVPAGSIDGVYTTPNMLAAEQAAMVRAICSSTAGVHIVEGVAGAGKTFALAAANEAWTASGLRVRGACLAARAAAQLHTGSGIPTSTLDGLLRQLDSNDALTNHDVVVIDEAAMVGTRTLLRLLEHAHRAHAKIVLIGDPRQLPEIEAGGALTALTARLGAQNLTTNRRQHQPWERHALTHLRAGRIDHALNTHQAHGRLHIGGQDDGDIRGVRVADWGPRPAQQLPTRHPQRHPRPHHHHQPQSPDGQHSG